MTMLEPADEGRLKDLGQDAAGEKRATKGRLSAVLKSGIESERASLLHPSAGQATGGFIRSLNNTVSQENASSLSTSFGYRDSPFKDYDFPFEDRASLFGDSDSRLGDCSSSFGDCFSPFGDCFSPFGDRTSRFEGRGSRFGDRVSRLRDCDSLFGDRVS